MTQETYKAAIYRGIGKVDLVDLPYPRCGDDEVIVRNVLAGVCGSDAGAFRHGGDDYLIWKDHEFGHEAISEVVEIGRDVRGLEVGDRVFVNQGKALRNPNRAATVGGFSEYIRIPQCEAGYSLLRIDNDLPPRTAVLFEPFVIGTRVAHGLDPGPDKTAIVFGAGIIGLCSAVMLRWFGCPKVMSVDLSDFRLEKAAMLGLITCNPTREDLRQKAYAEFGAVQEFWGERCAADLYVDAVGVGAVVDNFMTLAKKSSMLGVVGVHHEPMSIDFRQLCFRDLRIKGTGSLTTEEALEHILPMMRERKDELAALVTHEFKIDRISEALELAARTDEAQKVCIAFAP